MRCENWGKLCGLYEPPFLKLNKWRYNTQYLDML